MKKWLITYLLIGIIIFLFANQYIQREYVTKYNYVDYYVRGYNRAMRDNIVVTKYFNKYPSVNKGYIYFYIAAKAVKDIRKEVFKGLEAPLVIEYKIGE